MEDKQLLHQFMKYNNLLLRYHHQTHRGGHSPMADATRGQGRVLSLLKMKPEVSQKELAYLLDMRAQSLSELLSKLEDKGYITRTPSQEDRRVMMIRLTEKGAAAQEDAPEADARSPFGGLTQEEREQLSAQMDRLISDLEEMLGNGNGDGCRFDPRMGGCRHHGGHDFQRPPHHGHFDRRGEPGRDPMDGHFSGCERGRGVED